MLHLDQVWYINKTDDAMRGFGGQTMQTLINLLYPDPKSMKEKENSMALLMFFVCLFNSCFYIKQ